MRKLFASSAYLLLLSALALALACGDDDGPAPDAGPVDAATADAAPEDAGSRPAICNPQGIRWGTERLDLLVGATRSARLSLERDFCDDVTLQLGASSDGVVSFDDEATIPEGTSRVEVAFEGVAVGETTITATWTDRAGTPDEEVFTATLEVVVADETVPACETADVTGDLEWGDEVRLDGPVGLALPAGAERDDEFHVDPFEATVACAADQIPEGYVALGPAITFGPVHARFPRELPLTLPIKLALLPEHASRGDVAFAYTGPGVSEARVVPVASPDYETNPGYVTFWAPRLGTYQALVREGGPQERERTFSYRGITGVSMGSGGAALIGMHNPERFDFVGPLGGPVDWIHLMDYIRTYHLGGFCTEAERQAEAELPPEERTCDRAEVERTPENDQLFQVRQDFEHWYYVDEWRGHGGTFDRDEYIRIFRDLAMMYGNPNTTATVDPTGPNVVPPGIPDSERERTAAERCAEPVRIAPYDGTAGTGFFDDEYNPEGTYPVITFCDGAEIPSETSPRGRDIGVWDPDGDNNAPIEVALAVDIDDDGVRDPGEPVLRMGREPYEDCGLDQVCNPDEPGYDPVTNPDPNGDDYDFQYNPTGTENNWLRDYVGEPVEGCASPDPSPEPGVGERFSDSGLDGVDGTRQVADGGFDFGEADGCWTLARGLAHMFANNPRSFVLEDSEAVLHDLDFFGDGGIRDLFNFATNQNHLAGAFSARGLPLNLYNSHAALSYDGSFRDDEFKFNDIDWRETGKYVHIRYGDVDAPEGSIVQGDGQHVGTPTQVVNRILSVMAWMSARWPGGDRRVVTDRICTEVSPGCPERNQFTFEFTSPTTGRTGPVSIVLPPGYFDEEYADVDYPVVYLLHGYGQEPQDLVATGIIIWNFMTARTVPEANRFQKMIFVFPDGRCRGGECVKGTFYADAPAGTPDGAQMETFMLDLMDYVDENYRTKDPETHTVFE